MEYGKKTEKRENEKHPLDDGREWPDGNLRNIIHTSDNVNSATREIGIWFPEFDIKDKQ